MPYRETSDLPEGVRRHMPLHAQEIFLAAFNRAWTDHAGEDRQEEAAFRIAWGAVKRGYVKVGDEWVARG